MKAACPMAFPPGSIMTVGCMPMASNVLPSNPLIDRPVPSSPGMLNATLDGFNQVFAPMPSYTGIMPKGHRLSVSSDASMASLVPNEPNHVNHKTIGDNKENVSQQTSPKSSGPLKSRVSPVRVRNHVISTKSMYVHKVFNV